MRYTRAAVVLVVVLALGAAGSYAASDWLKGSADEKLKTLAEIQPGLGTVMIEYGNRYTTAYYAAKGGNWDLAAYQIKEAREIQEVGETTRPERAQALKGFEKSYLDPLDEAIKTKDFKKFEKAFKDGIQGCNTCHVGQGFPYIKYQLPKAPPSPLVMKP
ncbi:MAG TPA: hypothetical protein VN203_00545 [Candidatus Acidoferrum sp.]|nr:hypothetical protein [Candidatus Acidoferrum sp.]